MSEKPSDEEMKQIIRKSANNMIYQNNLFDQSQKKVNDQAIMLNTIEQQVWYLSDIDAYGASNQAHADFLGLKLNDIENKKLHDFLPHNVVMVCEESNREVFEKKETIISEEWIPNAAGENRLIEITKTPKIDKSGNVECIVCVGTDITERKQTEEALAAQRAQLKSLFDYSGEAIVLLDIENKILDVNSGFEQIFGYSLKEAQGKIIQDLICPERFFNESKELDQRSLAGIKSIELIRKRKSGEEIDVRASAGPIKVGEKLVGRFVVFDDISEQKQAEIKLRESEERFRFLAEKTADIIWTVDLRLNTIYVSPSIEKVLGFTPGERKQQPLEEMLTTESLQRVITEFSKALKREEEGNIDPDRSIAIELEYYRKDGSSVWMENNMIPMRDHNGDFVGIYGVSRDITERKQAVKQLEESEKKLRTIIEHSNEIFYIHDTEDVFTYVSPTSKFILGYTPEELERKWTDLITTNPLNRRGIDITENALRTGKKQAPYLLEVKRKDGTRVLLEIDESPVKGPDGKVEAIAGAARDVSLQKEVEERLRKSELRFRNLFAAISDIIYTQDLEGRFLSLNPAMCHLFGYDEEDLIGKRASDFMKPEFSEAYETEYLEKVKKEGHLQGTSIYYTKEGKKIYLEYRSSMVYPEDGEPYISGTGRDVTARIQSERQVAKLHAHLAQAQKMESIGTLAGGIAHNFNNVLMGIQGRASLMMMNKDSSHPDYDHLKGIEEYVRSASELTRDLLGFARGGKYEVKPTDLNALVKHENRMFGRTKKEIRIHGKYEKDLWTVEVDQGQIRQVFLNLYVNAWQAMPNGGDLYVQTENVTLSPSYLKSIKEAGPGHYVKISVTDTGVGMDDATREKVFDPFFSTKEMGQGSGLGLASVYGIIKNHGGFIRVSSIEGQGTTFEIHLPASKNKAVEEGPGTDRHEIRYGQGTVLLVDDEEMIVLVGRLMLEKLGYRVLVAGSGQEALDVYGEKKEEIDLVILDMVMPGMGGGETYDRLKEIDGDVKVLLSSGYSIDGQAKEIMDRGCRGFIQKPFAVEELSRRVEKVFDQ